MSNERTLEEKLRELHDAKHPIPVCPFCTYGNPCSWLDEYRIAARIGALEERKRIGARLRQHDVRINTKSLAGRIETGEFSQAPSIRSRR